MIRTVLWLTPRVSLHANVAINREEDRPLGLPVQDGSASSRGVLMRPVENPTRLQS